MSDRLAPQLRALRDEPPPAPFAPAEAVRRRGGQRARRQVAGSLVLACLVVVGAVVALATVQPDRTSTPARHPPVSVAPTSPGVSSGEPSPSGPGTSSAGLGAGRVSPNAMLQAGDLPGDGWTPASAEPLDNADRWYWAQACPKYRSADYPSLRQRLDVRVVGYAAGSRRVTEIVELYPTGGGGRNLGDVRLLLSTCTGTPPAPGSRQVPPPVVYTVTGNALAGDESMLVRVEQYAYAGETIGPTPVVWLVAVVRVGDLVATLLPPLDSTPHSVRVLAMAAAARLASA